VDELMYPITGLWNEILLHEIFNPLEVQKILQIPISPHLEDDFVACHKTKYFTFAIRSALGTL
jgi:hypothetical protein